MRVYISVDMEGVAGVVHEDQTDPIDPRHAGEYNRFRRLMTAEANAAVEGALAAGAERVLVNDSHWLMMNLPAEELHPAAELLSGGPKARSMMEGVELGFDSLLRFGRQRWGVASAYSVLLFIIMMTLGYFYVRALNRGDSERQGA